MYEMGADNRTTYTPVICPGGNNRSIYKATMFIYLTNFIDHVGGSIPGKRVFLGGFILPLNGAWEVFGVSKCLKIDINGINHIYGMGANNSCLFHRSQFKITIIHV